MVPRLVATAAGLVLLAPGVASASSVALPTEPISIGLTPASPRAGSQVVLKGGEGAPSYAWDLDGDGQFDDDTGKSVKTSFPAGTHTVKAQAVTSAGLLTDSRTFTVHEWNVPPTGVVEISPYSARVGVPVSVTARSTDPDGLTVQTELDLDGDGTFEATGPSGTATFPTPGERVIRARFTDDAGATSVASTTLDVHTGNLAPTVRAGGPPAYIAAGGAYEGWRVDAVDPDGRIVRYEFDLDGDGTYETEGGPRVPDGVQPGDGFRVRVTDDSGAVAVGVYTPEGAPKVPRVVEVGVPTTLSFTAVPVPIEWDADGDGAFDDGTDQTISFTYPAAGAYEVRVRAKYAAQWREYAQTTSARVAADIAVPTAQWSLLQPARASAPTLLSWQASGPGGVDANIDVNGDGVFADAPAGSFAAWHPFGGPATVGLKATDARGRTTVTTSPVPFVPGNLGPDVTLSTFDVKAPLKAIYTRVEMYGVGTDLDDLAQQYLAVDWDTDNDGEYDDGPRAGETAADGNLPASFGVRATDKSGVSATLRRTVTPIVPRANPEPPTATAPWLTVAAHTPRLATLLRRGFTVDVKCTRPKCKTALKVTVDAKTARKLGLRSRTVATKSVSGTRRVTVKLTAKARKALKGERSVKLTLTANATAEGGARSTTKTTLTIRKVAAKS